MCIRDRALIRPRDKKYMLSLALRVALTTIERVTIAFLIKIVLDAQTAGNRAGFQSGLILWILFYVGYTAVAPFILGLWRSVIYEVTANIREAVFRH